MDTFLAARILRLGVIRNMWQQGLLEESDAKELLAGPLEPGNESTIVDDSLFLNNPDGLIRAAEQRNEAEESIPAAICASCLYFKTECRGIQNGCEDWTLLP